MPQFYPWYAYREVKTRKRGKQNKENTFLLPDYHKSLSCCCNVLKINMDLTSLRSHNIISVAVQDIWVFSRRDGGFPPSQASEHSVPHPISAFTNMQSMNALSVNKLESIHFQCLVSFISSAYMKTSTDKMQKEPLFFWGPKMSVQNVPIHMLSLMTYFSPMENDSLTGQGIFLFVCLFLE